MKTNKIIATMLTILVSMLFVITPVFATETNTINNEIIVNTVDPISNTAENTVTNTVTNTTTNTVLDNTITNPGEVVTFQDLVDKVVFKLNEILAGMKAIASPVLFILFIVAAITAIFGAMSHKGSVWKGFWAMVTITIVYSVIIYAEVIVQMLTTWMAA